MPRPKDAMRGSRNAASHDLAQTDGRDRPIRCASLDADEHEDEGFDEVPIDDLLVDLSNYEVRLPEGDIWAVHGDLDEGLIDEASVRDRPLAQVARALGLLGEHVQDGAPEGWLLEI